MGSRRVEVSGSLQQGQGSAGGSRYSYYVILLPNYGLIVEVAISAILRCRYLPDGYCPYAAFTESMIT